jgi:hypothetical protein
MDTPRTVARDHTVRSLEEAGQRTRLLLGTVSDEDLFRLRGMLSPDDCCPKPEA